MHKTFITKNFKETQKLGERLSKKIKTNQVIALSGDLGSGKTTFIQGFLKGLKVKGPFTSPTFVVMKHYEKVKIPGKNSKFIKSKLQNIYHIDAYRVKSKDILNLGWEEITADKNNVIIIEWADRIRRIVPDRALWIKFKWLDNNMRKLRLYESKAK